MNAAPGVTGYPVIQLNRVIVNPHAGRKGGPNLTPELKLQFLRDRTEFDWRS